MKQEVENVITLGKIWQHHCDNLEQLIMRVNDECEVRGIGAKDTCEAVKVVKEFWTDAEDYKAGRRDCKAGVYDKWYRYNRKQDGRAYDKGWCDQNKTTKCESVVFLNA